MPIAELGSLQLTQAMTAMRELAVMGEPVNDTAEDLLRRHALGNLTGELLIKHEITVTDLKVDSPTSVDPPIYAYDPFNENMLVTRAERRRLDEALRTYDGSSRRWIARQVWFRTKKQLTGRVVGVDTRYSSLVMAGRHPRFDTSSFSVRWWVACADSDGQPLVTLSVPT